MRTSGYPFEASSAVANPAYGVITTHDAFHKDQGMGPYAHLVSSQQQQEMLPYTTSMKRAMPSYNFIRLRCLLSHDCPPRFLVLLLRRGAVRQTPMSPAYSASEVLTLLTTGSLSVKLPT